MSLRFLKIPGLREVAASLSLEALNRGVCGRAIGPQQRDFAVALRDFGIVAKGLNSLPRPRCHPTRRVQREGF